MGQSLPAARLHSAFVRNFQIQAPALVATAEEQQWQQSEARLTILRGSFSKLDHKQNLTTISKCPKSSAGNTSLLSLWMTQFCTRKPWLFPLSSSSSLSCGCSSSRGKPLKKVKRSKQREI